MRPRSRRDWRGARSFAAAAGLGRGQVIVRVDKTVVTTAKQAAEAISAANKEKGALLYLQRPNGDVESPS